MMHNPQSLYPQSLYAAQTAALHPWLGLISGLTLVALGSYLLLRSCLGESVSHSHSAGTHHRHSADPARPGAGISLRVASARRWLTILAAALMTALGAWIAVRDLASTGISLHSFSQQRLGPALFVAGLGLVLGIRHSTDPDHVVAISTIVTRQRSIRSAALIGTFWGLGHTLTIFIVGCLIILGGIAIPPRIGLSMEFSVGLMLILLGLLNLTGVMQKLAARFTPARSFHPVLARARREVALETRPPKQARQGRMQSVVNRYGAYQLLRPLAIGLVHGLAGSAAVALMVLSTIHNPLWAVGYLVIFGAGTMLGMMCMTAAMSLPLVYAGDRLPQVSRYLSVASGVVSVCFGSFLVYQLGYLNGLFTSHPHWTPQ